MKTPKVHCNECGRTVKDNPQSKGHHVLKYHPHIPLIRIATSLFSPMTFEEIGRRMGNAVLRMVNRG
jgi:hypothetical protein